jgi:hypothetical protein
VRRKLGTTISSPIEELWHSTFKDSLIFIEQDHEAALRTRAAALMYIGRNKLGLTTKVKDKEVWIMKDRDILGDVIVIKI